MTNCLRVGAVLAVVLCVSAESRAQGVPEAGTTLASALKPKDRITVSLGTDQDVRGRFVGLSSEELTIETAGTERAIPFGDIERVRRRRNGVLLGAIIGAGAGLAAGLPFKALSENEGFEGGSALLTSFAIGIGAGIGIDALLSRNRTVYHRQSAPRASLRVTPTGGGVRVALQW